VTSRKIELSGMGGWANASAAIDWLVENGVCFPEGSTIEASRRQLQVRIIHGDKWCVLEPDHVLNVKVKEVGPEGGPLLPPGPRGGPVPGTGEWVTQYDPAVRPRHQELTFNARCTVEPVPSAKLPEFAPDISDYHRKFASLVQSYRKKLAGGFLVPESIARDIVKVPRLEAYLVDGQPLVTVFTNEAGVIPLPQVVEE